MATSKRHRISLDEDDVAVIVIKGLVVTVNLGAKPGLPGSDSAGRVVVRVYQANDPGHGVTRVFTEFAPRE